MSATINFHIDDEAPAARIGGPYGDETTFAIELRTVGACRINVFGNNDQLAAIAKAILAHLERQEQGDFEQEVA
jgi:hypothetical protein